MEYFVLQAKIKLNKGDNHYSIPGLKNNVGSLLNTGGMTPPTQASVEHGIQEWIIPNNSFNQSWISQHYSKSHVIKHAGQERLFGDITTMEGMPAPLKLDKNDPLVNSPDAPKATNVVEAPQFDTETPAEIPKDVVVEDNSGLEAAEAIVARIKATQAKKLNAEAVKAAEILAAGNVPETMAPLTDEQLLANARALVAANDTPEVITPDTKPAPVAKKEVPKKKRLAPQKIAQLKVELSKKLTELGVSIPKNSTLPALEKLLDKELAEVS